MKIIKKLGSYAIYCALLILLTGCGGEPELSPLDLLAEGNGYFSEAPAGGGLKELYRSMRRQQVERGGVRPDRPAAVNQTSNSSTRVNAEKNGAKAKPARPGKKVSNKKRVNKVRTKTKKVKTQKKWRKKRRAAKKSLRTAKKQVKKRRVMTRSSAGYPPVLKPTPKTGYRYRTPDFYKGIYLTSYTARIKKRYVKLLTDSKKAGINTLVVDVQPKIPPREFIRYARESGFYLVARVVVFPHGLKTYKPNPAKLERVIKKAEIAAKNGFMEIQLDYIRFADKVKGTPRIKMSLKNRYRLIEGVLKKSTDKLRPLGVRVGGDIFGRIAFNRNDVIGQQVELFSTHLDTLYPMLYPSHFYGDNYRIRKPYYTILDGNKNCVVRAKGKAKSIAYIQGFKMSVRQSGLSFERYIQRQIQGAEDSGGGGYVVWNARNDYRSTFRALQYHKKFRAKFPIKK